MDFYRGFPEKEKKWTKFGKNRPKIDQFCQKKVYLIDFSLF